MLPQAVGDTVTALKGNPLCLAIVVLMIVLAVIDYYSFRASQAERAQIVTTLIERCMEPAKR
jgi:hypothetical protein